ncbi:hypothetical protein ACFOET_01810 [Parapedobacter deserti]|uniref:EfeO-type cupredoxin-like domain-containing protein n=1 Tax=Parapedobacter deserti TaxID=1912957 RepID=A0ABV7JE16_9SPHI
MKTKPKIKKIKTTVFVFAWLLLFVLASCEKRDQQFEEDVFRVTYLRPSDGCPSGPLIQFREKDAERLKHFLPKGHPEEHAHYGPISATNLDNTYNAGQSLVIKIRQPIGNEYPFCTANIPWYTSVYVLEVQTK